MTVARMNVVVTGGSGFAGYRLVEMLIERDVKTVVSFDLRLPSDDRKIDRVKYIAGDIRDAKVVSSAIAGADVVFHLAAIVGTFHPKKLFAEVNYDGTLNVIKACLEHNVQRLVHSSSPSTRMHGTNISGLGIEELTYPEQYVADYSETKAMAERAVVASCSDTFFATVVMPHQLYGPWDSLFLPSLMYVAKQGKLRIFGSGKNEISICYNDNYCYALILAAEKLSQGSPVVGKSYIVTDGGKVNFWDLIDEASVYLGYGSVKSKARIPYWLMMAIASVCELFTNITGKRIRLNMFTAKMLMIDRWFTIDATERDLGYTPLYTTEEAWPKTLRWFKEHEDYLINSAESSLRSGEQESKKTV